MKPFARIILVSSLALAAGCEFGPISDERVVDSLSRYVSESVARQIVNDDKNVSPETLAELSGKGGISYDEMTILLLHPNFPQERRSDLIRRGKSAHYLANASGVQRQTITDEDVKAMLEARGINDYLWRQTLECGGLAPDTYRSVYRKWVSHALYDDLKDNRFLVASSHLPKDIREDLLRRLSGVSIAPFILREHKRLSGSGADGAADVVEYMHVVDGWRRRIRSRSRSAPRPCGRASTLRRRGRLSSLPSCQASGARLVRQLNRVLLCRRADPRVLKANKGIKVKK